jgi:hypothetical protein
MTALSDERAQRVSERIKQFGIDIEMADLVYHGERSHVVDYLTAKGWYVSALPAREAHQANGFEFPTDDMSNLLADLSYVSAVLT